MSAGVSEEALQASLKDYEMQVSQLESALSMTAEETTRMELQTLLNDMRELVDLTQGSLLSLKKSRLMSMLDGPQTSITATPSSSSLPTAESVQSNMDDEFAAFQAAIAETGGNAGDADENEKYVDEGGGGGEENYSQHQRCIDSRVDTSVNRDSGHSYNNIGNYEGGDENTKSREEEEEEDVPDQEDFSEIFGARCRVTYCHEWGEKRHHNAMVVGCEPVNEDCEPMVRVMFCNPTHQSLIPCPFYLEGRCRFDEEKCRYSHGYVIRMEDLKEFHEHDHSMLKLESRCLARFKDGVWYPAVVVDILEGLEFKVMFDKYDDAVSVGVEDIIPLEEESNEDDEESDNGREASPVDRLSDEEEAKDIVPMYLWRPNQTTDVMGEWEKHTKGFGSRIMAKMGYVTGQGLGKDGEGRAEPVPIQLLPPGKSLDKIMELKEQAGDVNLYDVMKKNRRKQKQIENKASSQYRKTVSREHTTFEFINKKLAGKKGNLADLKRHSPRGLKNADRTVIHEADLAKRSDKHINIQIFKTHEEAKNVEKEIKRLKESLQRNDGKDKVMAAQVRQRLASMETYLTQLKDSSSSMQRHQKMRSDVKKFEAF